MARSEQVPQGQQHLSSRRARRAAEGDDGRRLNAVPFLIAAVLVLLVTVGLLWWFLWRDAGDEEPEAWEWVDSPVDGIHARDVPPEDWEAGWCLTGFVDEETPADVADCDQPYERQVMLRRNISDGPYPGDTPVIETAHQWCHEELELDTAALQQTDVELEIQLWHPTESTWRSDYDRMVSCFLVRADGAALTGDFLADEDDDADEEITSPDEAEDVDLDD